MTEAQETLKDRILELEDCKTLSNIHSFILGLLAQQELENSHSKSPKNPAGF